jgi:murein L,D-transpeptidase YcbB/YkuD
MLLLLLFAWLRVSDRPPPDVRPAIQAYLSHGSEKTGFMWTDPEQRQLNELYASAGYEPLWIEPTGRVSRCADETLALLEAAADEGLAPETYQAGELNRLRATRLAATSVSAPELARYDVALSAGMLRYLLHLHSGRVDPQTVGFRLGAPADRPDLNALLRSAAKDGRVIEAAAALRPPFAQYDALRATLSRYRLLALVPDSGRGELPSFPAVLHPGERYLGLEALRQRLTAFGDLPPGLSVDDKTSYEGALVEGVKRFQLRHGLTSDGIVGTSTQAALHVPLAWRVRQIELALERLRWLPVLGPQRLIAINIPMFRLWAWASGSSRLDPSFGVNVIVGRAMRTRTPVFVEQMREVIFRPFWNVPPSIARHEIVPLLERDPDYLRRQQMEIVRGPGDDARAVAATEENIALLKQGLLRVRQRPGPQNSLGLIKFVFPNADNVYMHGTPAQALFSRSRRDFSHGCVRVEDPVALAEWVLSEGHDWGRDRILSAMAGTQSIHVPLSQPIPVLLFYTTAAVTPEDGTIHFAEDIYRHDAVLDRALTLVTASHVVGRPSGGPCPP